MPGASGRSPGLLAKLKTGSQRRLVRNLQQGRNQPNQNQSGSANSSAKHLTRSRAVKLHASRGNGATPDPLTFAESLPEAGDRVLDLELEKLNETIGAWQKRKVVVTDEVLSFGHVDSEAAIATIPLWEIASVHPIKDPKSKKLVRHDSSGSSGFLHHSQTPEVLTRGPSLALHEGGRVVFDVVSSPEGTFAGKHFQFRAENEVECTELVGALQELVREATRRFVMQSRLARSREVARNVFESTAFQSVSAALIFSNFLFNVYQTQIRLEEGSNEEAMFTLIDLSFTVVFTVELCINAYGHWFRAFVSNRWSMFDAFVVSVSLLAVAAKDIPGINFVRLFRVFRVVRLFGRLKALRKIVNALSRSIVPVLNSFIILFLVTCIYAMLAVSFFGEQAPVQFGTFAQATLTLFILTSGGGWIDALPPFDDDGRVDGAACAFLVSYILIVNWTLLQVSVAVLLDNFVSATGEEEHAEDVKRRQDQSHRSFRNPMEPLLGVLANHFDNDSDLSDRIHWIFKMLDEDGEGSVHKDQLRYGLKALPLQPRLQLLSEDVEHMMEAAGLEGEFLGQEAFHEMLRGQVLEFVQRQATDAAHAHRGDDHIVAQMNAHKMVLSMLSTHHRGVGAAAVEELQVLARQGEAVERRLADQESKLDAIVAHLGLEGSQASSTTSSLDPVARKGIASPLVVASLSADAAAGVSRAASVGAPPPRSSSLKLPQRSSTVKPKPKVDPPILDANLLFASLPPTPPALILRATDSLPPPPRHQRVAAGAAAPPRSHPCPASPPPDTLVVSGPLSPAAASSPAHARAAPSDALPAEVQAASQRSLGMVAVQRDGAAGGLAEEERGSHIQISLPDAAAKLADAT